jgi:cytochrome oxidase Cu insertion factor (SCO1/SenC/PrrC family)
MRRRLALLVLLAVLLAACASTDPADQGTAAEPAAPASSAPEPGTAPPTTRAGPAATRPAPEGVVAPDLRVTAFDGRTVTLGGFRGKPAVVNFFESW